MDIKRYDVGGGYGYGYCDEEEQGEWVLFDDHYAVVASLQSELTKARELIVEFCKRVENGEVRSKTTYAKFKEFLAHQSAPIAKDE